MPDGHDRDFEALRSLLSSASQMAEDLLRDPLLGRLLNAFARMPEEDRQVIIAVLEREVQRRLISREVSDDFAQVDLHPNPNAYLYFRVIGQEQQKPLETVAFLRTANSLQRGVDALDPKWRDLVRQALRQLDREGLEKLNAFNQSMQEILNDVMGEAAAAKEGEAVAEEPPPSPIVTGTRSRG